jgi:choline kinase
MKTWKMPKKTGNNLTIIIPAASIGRRMKSHGAKSIIELNGQETVIERQLSILKNKYPKAEFILVVGFQADKIIKNIPSYVKVIENEFYQETNVIRSIGMALRITQHNKVLIIYGDVIFNPCILDNIIGKESKTIVDSQSKINNDGV